ncbi:VOC family protein [Lacibacterium aquatile]|uniref:2-oxoadipate dioxygenase/decarboxylase n=1 Tax=Lacibacterium aquatile TaxID=1168082 RepID=A0ABW5DT97_9PROT
MTRIHLPPDEIRTLFSSAMSDMYRAEVPLYQDLLDLVADVNSDTLERDPALKASLQESGELDRLDVERHGAIRLGKAEELFTIRRLFAVMGMQPVGYYDLSVAGIPVHSTAFRPIGDEALRKNPFRVFTSLLRLDLVDDAQLRRDAEAILAKRDIFTPRVRALIDVCETHGGLTRTEAEEFVREALETFRWHKDSTVSAATYQRLHDAHRLIADVVSFKGPHINHLTPRTLDIDAVQAGMPKRGITPKAVIEGPPRRDCTILLRQTSFKALEEAIDFIDEDNASSTGTHSARFGEIEQRGVALTAKGRKLYDELLLSVRTAKAGDYNAELAQRFKALPDDWAELRRQGLAYFRYRATPAGIADAGRLLADVEALIAAGYLIAEPMIYEDFLPVSAAGIFQSNLGGDTQQNFTESANRDAFEEALGAAVSDELALYAASEQASLDAALAALGQVKSAAE